MRRLSGGIDNDFSNDWKSEKVIKGRQIKGDSFMIQFVKFGAANALKLDNNKMEFVLPAPWLAEVKKDKGEAKITLPNDPKIMHGQNIMIAIMYSGESGEEFANYMTHPEDEMQLKFMSGVVNIVILDTPQAFRSNKNFTVQWKGVNKLDLLHPIVI